MSPPRHYQVFRVGGEQPAARYHALSPAAVASLVLGLFSWPAFFDWWWGLVPLAAILLGVQALRRIAWAPEEVSGAGLAKAGIIIAAAFWVLGSTWLLLEKVRRVPFGYEEVKYQELQPEPGDQFGAVPEKAEKLTEANKRVYIEGYMMPTRQLSRLNAFTLCPTNGVCQFCLPNPSRTEQIRITLSGDLTTDYTTRLIGVGGYFHVDKTQPLPYAMDVDCLK